MRKSAIERVRVFLGRLFHFVIYRHIVIKLDPEDEKFKEMFCEETVRLLEDTPREQLIEQLKKYQRYMAKYSRLMEDSHGILYFVDTLFTPKGLREI